MDRSKLQSEYSMPNQSNYMREKTFQPEVSQEKASSFQVSQMKSMGKNQYLGVQSIMQTSSSNTSFGGTIRSTKQQSNLPTD
mmetsp:Transcript_14991/g.25506  ORF Transcript_14991/g.25506 Transcript_14991/m.25506 type:complete len:82 (+) Transcript_14991:100-345(+)